MGSNIHCLWVLCGLGGLGTRIRIVCIKELIVGMTLIEKIILVIAIIIGATVVYFVVSSHRDDIVECESRGGVLVEAATQVGYVCVERK